MAGYSGTPLAKKLGIKPGATLMLLGAPEGFKGLLDDLADDVTIRRAARGAADVCVVFAKSEAELRRRFGGAAKAAGGEGRVWIAWPKQSSGVKTDLNGNVVRRFGLNAGWVDFKVCAIDEVWSGLAFKKRRSSG
ncbi:MAG: DUF3052 domain-containing protein [Planctomycetota bacterium]|nr:DUF3052 domain-containing protein [Planctomycetota bacterium]